MHALQNLELLEAFLICYLVLLFISKNDVQSYHNAQQLILCSIILIDEHGKIQGDFTVQRLESDSFMVVTGASFTDNIKHMIWQGLKPEHHDVEIEDCTETTALLNIQGPMSRDVLGKVLCKEKYPDVDKGKFSHLSLE